MDWVSPEAGVSWVCFPSALCFMCSFLASHMGFCWQLSLTGHRLCVRGWGGEGTAFCRTEAQAEGRWQLQSCANHTCTPGWDCMPVPRVPQQPPSRSGGTGGAREACARGLGQPLLLSEGGPSSQGCWPLWRRGTVSCWPKPALQVPTSPHPGLVGLDRPSLCIRMCSAKGFQSHHS